jgi:hypothetical protein
MTRKLMMWWIVVAVEHTDGEDVEGKKVLDIGGDEGLNGKECSPGGVDKKEQAEGGADDGDGYRDRPDERGNWNKM